MPNIIETLDAAGSTATTYTLSVGETAQGQLSSSSDHDWYRVNLVAGQTYSFAMTGTGTNNAIDTYLRLYAADGTTLLAQNDDGLPNANSVFTYTATTSGSFYIDAADYQGPPGPSGSPGQYGLAVTLGTRPSFDIQMGAGVIDTNFAWNVTPGTAVNVTYGFRQNAATYTANGSDISTFSQVTAAEMAAIQAVLQLWADVANITFTQINPGGYTDSATILYGNYNDPNDGAGAFAYYPGSTGSTNQAGDVWLNTSVSTTTLPFGSYSFLALIHETGHALGLSHPGLYNAASGVSITYANDAQFKQDSQQYTVMSYFDESNTGGNDGGYPSTPLLFDVYALQQIYGANMSTRTGDTIYGFGSNAGAVFDFAVNTSPGICIWDAGGIDTISCSNYSQTELISLLAGTFSNIGGLTANISIALGAVIENAIGGSGADTIIGNAADNRLVGGAGNDSLDGGAGSDTADYASATVAVTANLGAGTASGGAQVGTDTLISIENAIGGSGADNLTGSSVANVLSGGAGADTLNGGTGADTLTGGTGNDRFLFGAPSDGLDTITDFLSGSDQLALSGAGFGLIGTGSLQAVGVGFVLGPTATSAGPTVLYSDNVFYFDTDGTGAGAAVAIANVGGVSANYLGVATPTMAGGAVLQTGDFNGDGTTDILWEQGNHQVSQWLMQANGIMSQTALGSTGSGEWDAIATGDFDNDGHTDILWGNANTGDVIQWLMGNNGPTSQTLLGNASGGWSVFSTADYTGDGKTDFIWQRSSDGLLIEWTMNGSSIATQAVLGSSSGGWSVVSTGDFNGDGANDLIWEGPSGQVIEWLMGAGGVASQSAIGSAQGWSVIASGDFNGDGKSDLLWQQASNGQVVEWLMGSSGIAQQISVSSGASGWTPIATGDMDGNGTVDLMWEHPSDGQLVGWLMGSSGPTSQFGLPAMPGQQLMLHEDLNADGHMDLLWQRTSDGQVTEWLMGASGIAYQQTLTSPGAGAQLVAHGDFNNDGTTDLVWQTPDGATSTWLFSHAFAQDWVIV
jgi:serralysin